MRRLIVLVVLLSVPFFACRSNQNKPEIFFEDGVEVIHNPLHPVSLPGQPSDFYLEEEMSIDLERGDIAELGVGSVGEIAVDSKGNIYVVSFKNLGSYVFKFDRSGRFIKSFAGQGQGPGELSWPFFPVFDDNDNLYITDHMRKLVVYDGDGRVVKEKRFEKRMMYIEPLPNGRYLVYMPLPEMMKVDYYPYAVTICDEHYHDLKTLETVNHSFGNTRLVRYFMYRRSGDYIYIANEDRGYEFLVFDLDGRLVRKIRKDYQPVFVTDDLRRTFLGPSYDQAGSTHSSYFPEPMPPMFSFFCDDEGRLFVMTYEEGEMEGEYIYDLFNPDGIFIGRKSLNIVWFVYGGSRYTLVKNNRLYCRVPKDNGFERLVVYRMIWE